MGNLSSKDLVINSTTESIYEPVQTFSTWFVENYNEYKFSLSSVELALSVVGFVFNCLAFLTARKIGLQTAGTRWIKILACWDNSVLLMSFFRRLSLEVFGFNVITSNTFSCKLFHFLWWLSLINSSGHLVCLATDRALNLAFPTCHFKKDWPKLIPLISLAVTLCHCTLLIPRLFFHSIQDNICEMTSQSRSVKVYKILVSTLFSSFGHFILILIASLTLKYKLRQRRKRRNKPQSSKKKPIANGKCRSELGKEDRNEAHKIEIATNKNSDHCVDIEKPECGNVDKTSYLKKYRQQQNVQAAKKQKYGMGRANPKNDSNVNKGRVQTGHKDWEDVKNIKRITNGTEDKNEKVDQKSTLQKDREGLKNGKDDLLEGKVTQKKPRTSLNKTRTNCKERVKQSFSRNKKQFDNDEVQAESEKPQRKEVLEATASVRISHLIDYIYCGPMNLPESQKLGSEIPQQQFAPNNANLMPVKDEFHENISRINFHDQKLGGRNENNLDSNDRLMQGTGKNGLKKSLDEEPRELPKIPIKDKTDKFTKIKGKEEVTKEANLSEEDLKAINTVQYACGWYILITGLSAILYVVGLVLNEKMQQDTLNHIARFLLVALNSFNFLFYFRGKTFCDTFKSLLS